jgi:hypoxanthine-DNA glycosylase
MTVSTGFAPVERADASLLILGSLPGQRSITEQQYYAHPQNAFWPIMRELFGVDGDYAERCRQLTENGIALWDVLMSSYRPGSMDSDISLSEARPNDFSSFFREHGSIRLIAFNGRKAEQLYKRFVVPLDIASDVQRIVLPSTSPAYASLSFSRKLEIWREALCTRQ